MRIRIRHATVYRYDRPIDYAIQLVRLTPRDHAAQRTLWWRVVEAPARPLPETDDGYGNVLNMLTIRRPHREATVIAEGEVETSDTNGVLRGAIERLPAEYFRRGSAITEPDAALIALASVASGAGDTIGRLHRLAQAIAQRIAYEHGPTSVLTTASEALAHGRGVCQDHAHVFIACARVLGFPARYVSGYLWEGPRDGPGSAGHAWAEAHVDGFGWVGFDPANGVCPTDAYVRVAIGLDYQDAAPIRGLRRGPGDETLAVSVEVQQVHAQQQ